MKQTRLFSIDAEICALSDEPVALHKQQTSGMTDNLPTKESEQHAQILVHHLHKECKRFPSVWTAGIKATAFKFRY